MDTLSDDLRRLADAGPHGAPPPDLWERGRRRRRRRHVRTAVAGVAASLALVGTTVAGLHVATDRPPVASSSAGRLPDRLHVLDRDAPGTADDGPLGPLAALGSAFRSGPTAWPTTEEADQEPGAELPAHASLYGVAAAGGSYRWLDIRASIDPAHCDLAADGRLVVCPQVDLRSPKRDRFGFLATGLVLYDPVTDDTRVVPLPEPRMTYDEGDLPALRLSRDGRLVTASLDVRGHDGPAPVRVYSLDTGRWWTWPAHGRGMAAPGSAPTGAVWSVDGRLWSTSDGEDAGFVPLPARLGDVSYSPDGRTVLATRTYADQDREWDFVVTDAPVRPGSRWRVVGRGLRPNGVLGWLDESRVAVAVRNGDRPYTVVDTASGETVGPLGLPTGSDEDGFLGVRWATGLLGRDLVSGQQPRSYLSPEQKTRVGLGAGAVVLAGAALVWRRRRRRA